MSYAIHCNPNFYSGDIHGNDRPHLRRDYYGEVIALATEAEAQSLCDMLDDRGKGHYMLEHNQYAAPEHEVEASKAPARSMLNAMQHLDLQYDFDISGRRLPTPSPY